MHFGYPIFLLIMLMLSKEYCSVSSCLANVVLIRDGDGTLTSPNKTFELGFFGSFNARYLGIWHNPSKIVVWVANRDRPLPGSNGCFALREGNIAVLDAKGNAYWSSSSSRHGRRLLKSIQYGDSIQFRNSTGTKPSNCTDAGRVSLANSGELTFSNGILQWKSSDNPTDTFLPGMTVRGDSLLKSWQTGDNPAPGNFSLQLQQTVFTILKGGSSHWASRDIVFDAMPQVLSDILLRNSYPMENNSTSRLVMNFTGQVQLWKWEGKRGWSLNWSEPNDRCSFYNICGDFGSCNSENGRLCKCLPGFKPNNNWSSGGFSTGCSKKSEPCNRNFSNDIFLKLPMMKVGAANHNGSTPQDCETECLKDCNCVAYSCGGVADCKKAGTENVCQLWKSTDITNLQEEYSQGFMLFIRTNLSDIALMSRDCQPCGTNVIPYPLSTSANCGDPSYFNFSCNNLTGQLGFTTSKGTFKVTAITPENNTFTIQIRNDSNCDRRHIESLILSSKRSSIFKITNCSLMNESFAGVQLLFMEVEIAWEPPLEPTCKNLSDCNDWPHTTCKAARGKMRCKCESKFRWHGSFCKKVKSPLKLVVSCISGVLAVVLLGSILCIHSLRKRRMATRQDSVELQGDDIHSGRIDVPFFDWGSIVAATNNFADANKLGTGGFGAVYKGMLPDGKEIAVKRLSIVSEQGVEEFRTEVVLIAKLQHRNLVRLLGYCVKAAERILVYEYMPNGSLDSCLFDQTRSVCLDWEKRFEIIFGIARGLLYLHQDSRLRIIHRDLKPSNILLDEEMNPKISDFGIARIVGGKETEGSTKRVVGTYGYMAPEYAYEGVFSVKSDVFSFGVVVLETISGRRNSKLFQLEHGLNLQGYAWKMWNEDKGMEVMDETLKESCKQSEVLKCIHIGLLCVQEDPSDRATMSALVLMLGSEDASLPTPKQPAFISKKQTSETASSSSLMDSSFNDVFTFSSAGR